MKQKKYNKHDPYHEDFAYKEELLVLVPDNNGSWA